MTGTFPVKRASCGYRHNGRVRGARSLREEDLIRSGSEVHARRRYRPWRDAVFQPNSERRNEIELVGRCSTDTVTHVRDRAIRYVAERVGTDIFRVSGGA